MYSGKPLYRGLSVTELLRAQSQPPPSLPQTDSAIAQAILRCLDRDPGKRPRSAHAVLAALEDVSDCSRC